MADGADGATVREKEDMPIIANIYICYNVCVCIAYCIHLGMRTVINDMIGVMQPKNVACHHMNTTASY